MREIDLKAISNSTTPANTFLCYGDTRSGKTTFAATFPRFLAGLPDGGLIMCHPGIVDAELKRLDPLTHQREREFAFFNSENFPRLLAEHGVALAILAGA